MSTQRQKGGLKAPQTKNEAFRELLYQAHQNAIPFRYVLADTIKKRTIKCLLTRRPKSKWEREEKQKTKESRGATNYIFSYPLSQNKRVSCMTGTILSPKYIVYRISIYIAISYVKFFLQKPQIA